MKIRFFAALLLAALSITLLSGCVTTSALQSQPAKPSSTESILLTPDATFPKDPGACAADQTYLSKEMAIAIALNHAGLTEEQVVYRRAEFDWEGVHPIYNIDFYSGDREYDYEIHAETGAILEKESEPEQNKSTATATETPIAPTSNPAQPGRISKEDAIAIALEDAGFTQDQVTRLHAEQDYDDGRHEYEVEFHQGGYEYNYEIHAETGAILHKDIDKDD